MNPSHEHGLRLSPMRCIAALVASIAFGCVPAADDDGETGNDDGSTMMTTASTTATTSADDSTGEVPMVDYNSEVQPIFDENCVEGIAGTACHQPGGTWATNDLTPANSYDNLLNADPLESLQPFVEPGDPDQSYLWHKINATWSGPPANGSCCDMPLVDGMPAMDPGPLSEADKTTIRNWILGGAMP